MDNVVEVVFDYDDTVDEVDFTKDLLNAVALEAEDREPMVLDYGEDECKDAEKFWTKKI